MVIKMKNIGITVYGCERDEADVFRRVPPYYGVMPAIISDAVSEANAGLSFGNRCVSVSHKSEVSSPILRALKRAGVKYVSTRSAGCNHIDTAAARELGIAVEGVEYSPGSVADYAVMLMLMAARGAKETVRASERFDFRQGAARGKELRDMTVGVLGAGRIGGAVIERLRGFGCRVLACDRRRKSEEDCVTLDELLANSDILTLHVPLAEDTRHIIGREQIGKMKRGAFIVNTGRGALIDTGALVEALENGKLGGAALDVLEGEEGLFYFDCSRKPIGNPFLPKLQSMPNAIITPHTAYYTERALRDVAMKTIENCLNFERSLSNG
jgi:D-specific alpha-keto acid dehydrogenase